MEDFKRYLVTYTQKDGIRAADSFYNEQLARIYAHNIEKLKGYKNVELWDLKYC